jgi:molecular chaperone HtpG
MVSIAMATKKKTASKDKKPTKKSAGPAEETHVFQAEVSRLLEIVANALYSEKEIFIRELISNAADACDRLRYAAITEPGLVEGDSDFTIAIDIDKDAKTLTVHDNGIGMSHDEMVENLGTIARSGTTAFVEQLSGDAKKDVSFIGQFGVGFYSCFMVADRVEVVSRRAGENVAWRWTSDGKGAFAMAEAERDARGTSVTVHLKDDQAEFAEPMRVRHVITTYSDHIGFPITLNDGASGDKPEPVNTASALWTRPASEVAEQQYTEFYRHVSHLGDDPWATVHFRAEGTIEYTGLLFIPSSRPFDLFTQDRATHVRLYVKRVFITEDCEGLVPRWLRFLRGVIDSEDLPLNISREMLQNNPVLARIRNGLVSRVIRELTSKAEKDPDAYAAFWKNFGAVLKEGLYEAANERDALLGLARFRSTHGDALVGLSDYVGRMKEGQESIYYISGDELDIVARSPQLEGFQSRGIEVLLMTDPVDQFWLPMIGAFEEKTFKSVTQGGADFSALESDDDKDDGDDAADKPPEEDIGRLIAAMKVALGEEVKDIRVSDRLTQSAVCLVADEGDMDMNMERMLQAHRQIDTRATRILELNPNHALIRELALRIKQDAGALGDAAHLLLDQARILEGEPLPDPTAFARRLSNVMTRSTAN